MSLVGQNDDGKGARWDVEHLKQHYHHHSSNNTDNSDGSDHDHSKLESDLKKSDVNDVHQPVP